MPLPEEAIVMSHRQRDSTSNQVPPLAVSMGMALVPFPGGKNDLPDITVAGRPSQLPDDLCRRCDQYPRIARSTANDLMGDRAAASFLAGSKYFEHRHAGPRAHIVGSAHTRLQGFDGKLVSLGEILGMNVVAHAGSVTGGVITSED